MSDDLQRYRPEYPGFMMPDPDGVWVDRRDVADRIDALEAKLEKAVEALREAETAPEPDHHVPQFRHVMDVIGATLAQITEGKTDG